jgi:hypothetical protein
LKKKKVKGKENNHPSIMVLVALLTILMGLTPQRANSADGITSIESYCKNIDRYVEANPASNRIFADVSSGVKDAKDNWREFKSEDERNKVDDGENLNQNASVWLKSGNVVVAYCMFQSPSRDWAHYVTFYFRADGSLSKIHSVLNTFLGNMQVIRDQYYSSPGKMLQSSVQYLDLQTQKQKKPTEDFVDETIPVYKRNKYLPFINLLKSAPQQSSVLDR